MNFEKISIEGSNYVIDNMKDNSLPINKGDWYVMSFNKEFTVNKSHRNMVHNINKFKIIATNDKDLNADGVLNMVEFCKIKLNFDTTSKELEQEFITLKSETLSGLDKYCNDYAKDGYHPVFPIFIDNSNGKTMYAQQWSNYVPLTHIRGSIKLKKNSKPQ